MAGEESTGHLKESGQFEESCRKRESYNVQWLLISLPQL